MLLTAAIAVAALEVAPAQADAGRIPWRPTVLPLPAGADPARHGYLRGSDGKGEYTGSFWIDGKLQVVSWRSGKPVVRGVPGGYDTARVDGEDGAGVVYGIASGETTSLPFVLDATGFHIKEIPAPYTGAYKTAVSPRGDLAAELYNIEGDNAAVAWPAGGKPPVLIPRTNALLEPEDIDDDGTILFGGLTGSTLWKDGVTRPLVAPRGSTNPYGQAIRHGVVVGYALHPGATAVRWNSPEHGEFLPGGELAVDVNRAGISAGWKLDTATQRDVPVAWRGSHPAGDVLTPPAYPNAQPSFIGDDGVIGGIASSGDPSQGGVPVIWRFSL